MIAFQKQEQQLEQQRSKYGKLMHTFRKLQDTSETHSRLVEDIISKHLIPYAQRNNLIPRSWTEETILDLLDALSRDAANAGLLQTQIQILQKEMLAKVDKIQAGPDEHFAKEFRVIASLIKTLSRTIRLAETADVEEALGCSLLHENVPHKH
jgi:hypothetical protein